MSLYKQPPRAIEAQHLHYWRTNGLQDVSSILSLCPGDYAKNHFSANIYGIMRFYLVSAKPKGSFVTGSKENSYNWSNEYSLLGGLYRDLIENGIIYSLIQVLAMILSVLYALMIIASTEDRPMSAIFVTVAWPPLLHIFILGLKCHSVPIRYLFDPPRYPDLAELKTEKVPRQNEVIQETLKGMHEASKHILRSQTRIELRDELLT